MSGLFFGDQVKVYLIDELPDATVGKKVMGSLMGVAYLFGAIVQGILYPSDKKCIKFGILFSIISLFILVLFNLFLMADIASEVYDSIKLRINGLLQFLFAFGFGFFIPALFSIMSQKIENKHTGRLFGAVDTTDTAALSVSEGLVAIKNKFPNDNLSLSLISFILFCISFIIYYYFIKIFVSYEEPERKKNSP